MFVFLIFYVSSILDRNLFLTQKYFEISLTE